MGWHWFDWIVILIYFTAMLLIGVFFGRKTKSTDDYFNAGARVPAIITGLSIYATGLSSISFIAVPGSIYNNGWLLGMAPLGIMLLIPLVAAVFVPFFRRLKVTTIYEWMGSRFSYSIRLLGSLSFIAFHIVRMAIVLYLPTLAMIQVLPSLNPVLVTLLVGLFCVAYTSIGGIGAFGLPHAGNEGTCDGEGGDAQHFHDGIAAVAGDQVGNPHRGQHNGQR